MAIIDSTPFGKPDSRSYQFVNGFQRKHSNRLRRYEDYWRFYRGYQWIKGRHPDDHFVTMNYCTRIVDIHADFLMKDGFKIVIPDDPETEDFEPSTLDFLSSAIDRVWDQNERNDLALNMAQMSGITGDCFVRVSLEQDRIMGAFPRIEIIPSSYVYPTFHGPHGPAQSKLHSVLIAYPKFSEDVGSTLMRNYDSERSFGEPEQELQYHVERWYDDRVIYYQDDGKEVVQDNPFGVIPIVHIPNYPISGEFYGRSDLAFILPLQRELNEKATDISDVINYHGSPVTVVKGVKVSHLERGANRTWSIPEHASIENLALNGELNSSLQYLDLIRKSMFEISGIPEQVISPTHQYQSAVAGSLAYNSMLNLRKSKITSFRRGIREINGLIVRVLRLIDNRFDEQASAIEPKHLYNTEVVFGEPLPRNETIELDRAEVRLRLGLSSRRHEMERMGLSRAEISQIKEENAKEQEDRIRLENTFGDVVFGDEDDFDEQENRSGNPNPLRPNPILQGEAKSRSSDDGLS
jgi:hypothetical protein